MNIRELWQKRFSSFLRERGYYIAKMVQGYMILPVFLFLLAMIYYPMLLESIPATFPLPLLMLLVYTYYVSNGIHRSFLREADLVFLLPGETSLSRFYTKGFLYNWLIQGFGIVLISVILAPLYTHWISTDPGQYIRFVGILLLLKGLNLWTSWGERKLHDTFIRRIFQTGRIVANGFILFALLYSEEFFFIFSIIVWAILIFLSAMIKKTHLLNWMELLRGEQRLDVRFYRLANLFLDVPHLQKRVIYRKILPRVTRWIPFATEHSYHYIFVKLFLRNELSQILLRLTLVGAFLVFVSPAPYGVIIVYGIFLSLCWLQFRTFWEDFHHRFWFDLYPLPKELQKASYIRMNQWIMLLISSILVLPAALFRESKSLYLFLLLFGFLFSYICCNRLKNKIKNS